MEFIVRTARALRIRYWPATIALRLQAGRGIRALLLRQRAFPRTNAKGHLEEYLADRRDNGLDTEVGVYTAYETAVDAPWGDKVAVAYAIPSLPRPH